MARARRFGETAVTARIKFRDKTLRRRYAICGTNRLVPSHSPRYGERGVRRGRQILDDFVKMRLW